MSEIRSQATPARDELERSAIGWQQYISRALGCNPGQLTYQLEECIEKIEALKPRTVNDVDQLEALPAGTVLRNNKSGRVFEKAHDKGAGKSKWMRMQDRWVYETYEILNESTWTVLFTPGDAG
ncbi:hypothetical protein [Rhodococcus qingshengii]|uniref:hypothetical protein n=1 Tax=Rhodococcus qingshengii TaxID=334542 RepID=UPI001ADED0D3|nr:hypothetical protein [Rhodococcus qingshengii]MCQ4148703.1 hypothetical protein [Rhodococcus qingshengii]